MSTFHELLKRIRKDDGQDLAEYGIALAVIAIGAILIAFSVVTDVQSLWSNGQGTIHSVASVP
jgi:Flp pilus assembly pilin Flp